MTLRANLSIAAVASLSAQLDLTLAAAPLTVTYLATLASGTGAGQADKMFSDTRTLTASSSEDLDLAGSLVDALGATVTFVKIKGLIVAAAAGNTNNVVVGGVAAGLASGPILPQTTGQVTLRPGAAFAVICGAADATGYPVTATTADLLHIANGSSGTSVTYDIIIIGTSA